MGTGGCSSKSGMQLLSAVIMYTSRYIKKTHIKFVRMLRKNVIINTKSQNERKIFVPLFFLQAKHCQVENIHNSMLC
jgi:hypothetical protein